MPARRISLHHSLYQVPTSAPLFAGGASLRHISLHRPALPYLSTPTICTSFRYQLCIPSLRCLSLHQPAIQHQPPSTRCTVPAFAISASFGQRNSPSLDRTSCTGFCHKLYQRLVSAVQYPSPVTAVSVSVASCTDCQTSGTFTIEDNGFFICGRAFDAGNMVEGSQKRKARAVVRD